MCSFLFFVYLNFKPNGENITFAMFLKKFFHHPGILLGAGLIGGMVLFYGGKKATEVTSTDAFCASCHVHPHATDSWKQSTHYDNQRGIVVHCVDCHLPPHGFPYLREKVKTGMRDVWSTLVKDQEKINWEEKKTPEAAERHTYQVSCIACHSNLFPRGLSREGEEAHLYFSDHQNEISCVRCHLQVGHYREGAIHAHNVDFGKQATVTVQVFTEPVKVDSFVSFTERIPGSTVQFDMVAIPGGTFVMGSPADEPFRKPDEGPRHTVHIRPFFMGKLEVSWDEYLAFFTQTGGAGHGTQQEKAVDGISGPTPPWGDPAQGWGRGTRPAITMTWQAAEAYCKWLSKVTGKHYRLPTEAEWEYAARGGTQGPYFFEGNPKKYSRHGWMKKIVAPDTAVIGRYVIYGMNSGGKTAEPSGLLPNPFGLVNMLGNVAEFCSDWYAPEYPAAEAENPAGPAEGTEKVIRGGSFMSDAADVRCAARDYTRTTDWLKTDPQIPKSIWWYSDCRHVGFRVVCDYPVHKTK